MAGDRGGAIVAISNLRLCLRLRPRTFFRKVLGNLQKSLGQGQRVCDRKTFGKDFFLYGSAKKRFFIDRGIYTERGKPLLNEGYFSSWLKCSHVVRGGHLRDPAAGNPYVSSEDRGIRSEFEDRGGFFFYLARTHFKQPPPHRITSVRNPFRRCAKEYLFDTQTARVIRQQAN